MHGMQRPTTKVAQKVNVEVVKRETSLLTQCAGICTVAVLDTLTDVLANSSDYNSEDVKAREEKKKKRSVSREWAHIEAFLSDPTPQTILFLSMRCRAYLALTNTMDWALSCRYAAANKLSTSHFRGYT